MSLKKYKGKDLRIRLMDGRVIAHATDCSFTTSRNFEGVASKDTDGEESEPGTITWGLSTNYLVADVDDEQTEFDDNTTDTHVGTYELLETYLQGVAVQVEFTTNIAGQVIISGMAFMEGTNISAPASGQATGDISFKGNGVFVLSRVASPQSAPTNGTTIDAVEGESGSYQITASNSPTNFGFTGTVPAGVVALAVSNTGLVTWNTSLVAGTYTVQIVISNASGFGTYSFTVNVAEE